VLVQVVKVGALQTQVLDLGSHFSPAAKLHLGLQAEVVVLVAVVLMSSSCAVLVMGAAATTTNPSKKRQFIRAMIKLIRRACNQVKVTRRVSSAPTISGLVRS
jgi:hypothetical protein